MTFIQTNFDNTPVKSEWRAPSCQLPSQAQVVIVGGGIAGASLAYYFAKAGWSDVVLLEQNQVSSGTTWHSAGQVGQLRSSSAQTQVNKASAQLYASLLDETGHDPGWLQCGGLQLASCEERMHQLNRNAAMAGLFGVEASVVGPDDCQKFWPMLHTDDLLGGVYLPGDGRVLPGECTVALAKGAIAGGVKVVDNVRVTGLCFHQNGQQRRITGVETDQGPVVSDWVVLAGNMWMRQLGLSIGVDIPVYPCEHHYVITRPIEGVTRNAPCTRDPNAGLYFRALDDGGLKLGAFKRRSKPWGIEDSVPHDFAFQLLEPDWSDFESPLRDHLHRLRGVSRDDIVKFVNGPEAFTPDNNFIMGQPFLTEGLFVLGGWNSAGIACAGGAGKYAVEWIENGGMTLDLAAVDILRFLPFQNRRSYLKERVSEVLGLHYQMAWPGRQMESARGVRASALKGIHAEQNACFGETAGWERPLFYAPQGVNPQIEYSFVRQNWHDWVCDEVLHCRNQVALMDQSTFAKYEMRGPDALRVLQKLCGNNVDVVSGQAVYTGMFNSRGTFESDLTVIRLGDSHFYIVTATARQYKDLDWLSRHSKGFDVEVLDVTDRKNVISVMGPASSSVLKKLDSAVFDDSNEPVRYGRAQGFQLGNRSGLAVRISYVGETGWELHVDQEDAVALYAQLKTIGQEFDIKPIGNHAISAMRIEKGFRAIGHELSTDETALEAGLGWAVDWRKDFIGKDALLKQKERGLTKRLMSFVLLDSETVLWGGEPIYWDGEAVGYTTSACFSPTLGTSVAMGYVKSPGGKVLRKSDLRKGNFTIQNNGTKVAARCGLKSPLEIASSISVESTE